MGLMDTLKAKMKGKGGQDLMRQHGDKIDQGMDRAGSMADRKTKGKYSRHIETGTGKAKDAMGRHSGRKDNGGG